MHSEKLLMVAWMAALVGAGCGDNQTPAPEYAAYEPGGLEPLTCVPNLDSKIDADELREALRLLLRPLLLNHD